MNGKNDLLSLATVLSANINQFFCLMDWVDMKTLPVVFERNSCCSRMRRVIGLMSCRGPVLYCIQMPCGIMLKNYTKFLLQTRRGIFSKRYLSLLFGAPRLVRFVTISGREFLPSKGRFRPLKPEIIEAHKMLSHYQISLEQLIDLAILIGTDFNHGIKGIGPKTALKLIKEYGSIEHLPSDIRSKASKNYRDVREIFYHSQTTEDYHAEYGTLDEDGLDEFLCKERDFSPARVKMIIERMKTKDYIGQYRGNQYERDRAYHQGTVWAWLICPYISAYARAYAGRKDTRKYIEGLFEPFYAHLFDAGLGAISEIFDGDCPHTPRGCISQAWSVAEILLVYFEHIYGFENERWKNH